MHKLLLGLQGRLGNMTGGSELNRHLSGLKGVEWSALGRRSQVHSFTPEPRVSLPLRDLLLYY